MDESIEMVDADASGSSDGGSGAKNLDPSTHFAFQHKIFQVPGARFALTGPDRIPALRVDVGEHEASVWGWAPAGTRRSST